MDESAKSGVRTRKRNKSIKDSAKLVLESIPQIPIHVTEIKKLILKDNPGFTVESCLDQDRLLSILTNGATGRNPTFFKAYGHQDVFGLRSAIPDGCSTLEVVENVPNLDAEESDEGLKQSEVLYVRLPEGHPVITASSENESKPSEVETEAPELSIEEAIEQAEVIFDDDCMTESGTASVTDPVQVDVESQKQPLTASTGPQPRTSPRISPRIIKASTPEVTENDAKLAEALSKSHHNLRPKRPLRHVQALKQQAKRRKRNTNLASGSSGSPVRVSSVKKSTFNSNGDIEIHYTPSKPLSDFHSMKDVLSSISGFSLSRLRKKMSKKTSISAAIASANEGSIDLETPDSILSQVNPRSLLNKSTFLKLPPEYQYKLSLLLPQVDRQGGKLNHSSLNNEFFAKACQEWKERLMRGDFTPETLAKAKADIERDKAKTDPWKMTHFEPVWGIKRDFVLKEEDDEVQEVKASKPPRRSKINIADEDEPLLKKAKPDKVQIEDPLLDIDQVDSVKEEETVIEEPVNLLEEQDSISEPPLRSCSIDDEVSIPSPMVYTPPCITPPVVSTPLPTNISLPKEPLPLSSTASDLVACSPASVRSTRGNSVTFSSSRSPSPAASSMASSQEDQSEQSSKEAIFYRETELKIPLSEVDMSLLKTTTMTTAKPKTRTHPTAALNKNRPPKGDVNLERSLEIVRSAVEKSVKSAEQQPVIKTITTSQPTMIIRPPTASPAVTLARPPGPPPMTNAVLVTTADGKTILAHPASQILQQVRPMAPTSVRVRLPVSKASPAATIVAQPQVRQVRLIGQRPTVIRLPVSTASAAPIDPSQLTTLMADANKPVVSNTIVVKAISPSPSPVVSMPSPAVTTATRLIQIGSGGQQRFIRPTTGPMTIRGQLRPATTPSPVFASSAPVNATGITTNPIIVRTSSPNTTTLWPSQPLTTIQLQDLFQRPRPPPAPSPGLQQAQVRLQGHGSTIVRTILVPRSGAAPQHIVQPQVNTPLPNIQLPSEPVPISPQEIVKLQHPNEPLKVETKAEDGNRTVIQLPQAAQQQAKVQQGTKLILIQQPNGQLLAVPATQMSNSTTINIPPRASSAPPTEPLVNAWPHPTRPASVDAVGILKSGSNSLRASPKSLTPSPMPPSATPPLPAVAATPPMPTLEPNESLSIRASIDSSVSDAERPELTEEVPPSTNGHTSSEVDENAKPVQVEINGGGGGGQQAPAEIQASAASTASSSTKLIKKIVAAPSATTTTTKVLIKPYGVPLLPKPPSATEMGQNSMACNVKALVVCKQCGKFCHNDCISSSNVCVSCLIR